MTKWLASVQSLDEAKALEETLPDIMDLKDPHSGALGALPTATVKTVVDWVDNRCQTSATVGDLVMQAGVIADAVKQMAATGVDYVKVGLFSGPDLEPCLTALIEQPLVLETPLIAVLFADQSVDLSLIESIKQAGFCGVMVDTANKNGQRLLDHWPVTTLHSFVREARQHKLLCGLAGALSIEDIALLEPLGADYLGFRSALCDGRQRTLKLQPEQAQAIQQRLQSYGLAS
jgi:(5-formylfuran-3-yl)methyl phosphate synthase